MTRPTFLAFENDQVPGAERREQRNYRDAAAAGLAWGTAKFAFDAMLQASVPPDQSGKAFIRSETLFQLAWVIGAIIPVGLTVDAQIGLALAGVAALTAQTVFVSGLLIDR